MFNTPIKGTYIGRKSAPRDILRVAINRSEKLVADGIRSVEERKRSTARRLFSIYKKLKVRAYRETKRQTLAECLDRIVESKAAYRKCIEEANSECLALSLKVAREIVEMDVKTNRDALANRISRLLSQLLPEHAEVYLNPADQVGIESRLATMAGKLSFNSRESIAEGNAEIKSSSGTIELNWQYRLSQMEHQLRQELHELLSSGKNDAPA